MNKTKRLGQHILKDVKIIKKIVSAAQISENDIVFELGSGRGDLTEVLCKSSGKVISTEIDYNLFLITKKRLAKYENLELINCDALKTNYDFNIFVSNIPYSKSREFVEWLVKHNFERAVVTVQKEFAEKIIARPNAKNYRALTVISQGFFFIERLFDINKTSFDPIPKVDSTVLLFKRREVNKINSQVVLSLKKLFSFRSRILLSAIKLLSRDDKDYQHFLKICNSNLFNRRIESLNIDEAFTVAEILAEIKNEYP